MKFSIQIKTYNGLLLWYVNFNKIMPPKTMHIGIDQSKNNF